MKRPIFGPLRQGMGRPINGGFVPDALAAPDGMFTPTVGTSDEFAFQDTSSGHD
jgi:hypothetical protein